MKAAPSAVMGPCRDFASDIPLKVLFAADAVRYVAVRQTRDALRRTLRVGEVRAECDRTSEHQRNGRECAPRDKSITHWNL